MREARARERGGRTEERRGGVPGRLRAGQVGAGLGVDKVLLEQVDLGGERHVWVADELALGADRRTAARKVEVGVAERGGGGGVLDEVVGPGCEGESQEVHSRN